MSDSLAEAAARLEAAVERLARVAAGVAARPPVQAAGVPMEEVAALSARLEATIARLRAALPDGADLPDGPEGDETGLPEEGEEPGDVPRRAEEG
ncbi:hypothetical protein SAMN02745194_02801 [Roseomonas rosea]|uniref:Uncharacterized protein n=1 Tax=Muricoccus roseus TaxID=198092 RepID=A0A1M6K2V9_9PROT|nr:hypothetical protein [Roseomonas rosea]SHJ53311.1 hypothetical protein SAMN02745194_02801 [Roseomonas rosea]